MRAQLPIGPGNSLESFGKWIISLVIVVGLLGLAAYAINENYKHLVVKVPIPGGQSVEVTLEGSDNLFDILECVLGQTATNIEKKQCKISSNSNPELLKQELAAHGYYFLPSREAAAWIRSLDKDKVDDTNEFANSLRSVLYDLAGPFAEPWTFQGATDDRLLKALEDLKPSSPLIAQLWVWSLEWKPIFYPEINVVVKTGESLERGHAAACMGAILADKDIYLRDQSSEHTTTVSVDNLDAQCQGLSASELLSAKPETVWLSKSDYDDVHDNSSGATPSSLHVIGRVFPKHFSWQH